jgi:hypothetical protein
MQARLSWRLLLVAWMLVAPAAGSGGQARPNYSGTWTQSGPPLGPDSSHIERIELADPVLKVTIDGSGPAGSMGMAYHLDHTYSIGAPAETRKFDDGRIRSVTVTWEGLTLVFVTSTQEGANTTTEREVWSVSDDGTTLTKTRETTSWRGTSSQRKVFKRKA